MSRRLSALLAAVLALGSFPTLARADDVKRVRNELESNYTRIVEGFKKNDPEIWVSYLMPDFKLTLFNGSVQDRQWAVNYVRNNAKTFQVKTLNMLIKELTTEGNDAVAVIEQKSSREFTDEQRKPHRLDVDALQRETWTKTPSGWMLKSVQEWKVLYVLQDGKPMTQSK